MKKRYIATDSSAIEAGKFWGKHFRSSPDAAAAEGKVRVDYVPCGSIVSPRGKLAAGRAIPGERRIELEDSLPAAARRSTLAHELGHLMGYTDEGDADAFADTFLAQVEDDLGDRRRRWREWQEKQLAAMRASRTGR